MLGLIVPLQASLAVLDLIAVGLLGTVALLATGAATESIPPQLDHAIASLGLTDVSPSTLAIALAAIAGLLMVTKSAASFLATRRVFRFLADRQARISSSLCIRVLSRPLLDIQNRSSQEVAFSVTLGVNALTMGVIGNSTVAISELVLLSLLSVGLAFVDPLVTAFTVIFFGVVILALLKFLSTRTHKLGIQLAAAQIDSIQAIQELIRSYREIFVAGRRDVYVQQFNGMRRSYAAVQAQSYVLMQLSKYALEVALIVGAALLALSQVLTRDVAAATAVLAVFLGAISRIMPSLLRLQAAILVVRSESGVAEPTLNLVHELASNRDPRDPQTPASVGTTAKDLHDSVRRGYEGLQAGIELSHVTLKYPDAHRPAISDVNLTVPAGTSLALVGPTGAGKSTLADVILGVAEPNQGRVRISGMPPRDAITKWPGAIAYVAQDTALVNADIRSNVALGLPADFIDDERVHEALAQAHLLDFVSRQHAGLRTLVGENGVKLSGGQRQRLGLARALYTRPKLLVLDEATSALDAETEHAIAETLSSLGRNITLVVVAHRLATIRELDRVVYIEDSRILASGDFETVRKEVPDFDGQARLSGL